MVMVEVSLLSYINTPVYIINDIRKLGNGNENSKVIVTQK